MNGISLSAVAYVVAAIFIMAGLTASVIACLSNDKTFYQRCKEAGGIPMPSSYKNGVCLSVNAVIRLEEK